MTKRILFILTLLCAAWAQSPTVVKTESELTAAVASGSANIQLGNDIRLSNYLNIDGRTVTIDLAGHKLYRSVGVYASTGHVIWAHGGSNQNPVFNNVTISYVINPVGSSDGTLVFHGNYGSYSTDGADNTMLYLGADNKLYYPSSAMTIGSCRAYFTLYGVTAGEPNSPEQAPVRAFVLNIGDEANGITTTNYTNYNDAWYTLDGRQLSGKPSQRGVYINNRSKVVIK